MTAFLIAAALLVAASLALLSRPWWRRRQAGTDSRRALNAAIYRDQLAEIEKDRASGELSESDYLEARAEVQRRLLEDTADAETVHAAAPAPKRTLLALLVLLPLAAAGLYAWLGNPAGMDPMARRDFTQSDIEEMVAGLAAKLEKEPENHQGWLMLARSYKAMGRLDEAEHAFEKAMPLVEQHAQLLDAYADLLATKAGGNLAGKPEELIAKALKLDPDDLQALWLAGTAAFNRNDYAKAVEYWQHASKLLPAESEDAQMLTRIIEEARQKAGLGAAAPARSAVAPANAGIKGRVELAPALKAQAVPTDTVFIVAKAAGGPPTPLAAKRARVADLPLDFTLDDGDAVMPSQKISSATALLVEARISKSGDARSQPGDLLGKVSAVKPGAKNLRIVIDKVVR